MQTEGQQPNNSTGPELRVPSSVSEPVAPTALGQPEPARSKINPAPKQGKQVVGSERAFRAISYGFALLRGILVILLLAILFNLFVATVFRISGESMYPSFEDGQFILVDRLSYVVGQPERGDVVILEFPGDPEKRKFIKRVIGLPGEQVEIKHVQNDLNTVTSEVYVDDQLLEEDYLPAFTLTAPEVSVMVRNDEVFVMGDNRPNSNDSRFFGPVPEHNLIGVSRAVLSGSAFGFIAQPAF